MPVSARFRKPLPVLGLALCLTAAAWGVKWLTEYSFAAIAARSPAETWPAGAGFSRADGISTLVVALHPECPCSRATVAELTSLLEKTTPRLRAILVFLDNEPSRPAGASELFQTTRQFPGVTVVRDRDGSELQRFGFTLSGETRLYQPDGTLVFRGGITPSRGQTGDNPGRSAVLASVRAPSGSPAHNATTTPAFGCELFAAANPP